MAYTKDDILGFTGGSLKGEDIYAASQKHGFSASDYDQAFGAQAGTAQAWIDKNVSKPAASLDTPPVGSKPAANSYLPSNVGSTSSTSTSSPVTNSNPGNDPMIAMRGIVDAPTFWKEGGKVDTKDAMSLYGLAMSGQMDADQVAMATGIPVANINDWLTRNGLSLGPKKTPQGVSLDAPPPITATTRTVQQDETAAYQLMELLRANSPYIKYHENKGIRRAQARGGINSSIAAGNAVGEAIGAAAPIAINDANTYSRQGLANQDATNQAAIVSAQLAQSNRDSIRSNQTSRLNTGDQITQSERESVRSNETSRLNQLAQNETSMNLQKLSDQSRERMEQFRVKADIDIADRSARTNAFNNMIVTLGNIEGNGELNAQQKSEAINRTVGYYETFLSYQDTLLGRSAA